MWPDTSSSAIIPSDFTRRWATVPHARPTTSTRINGKRPDNTIIVAIRKARGGPISYNDHRPRALGQAAPTTTSQPHPQHRLLALCSALGLEMVSLQQTACSGRFCDPEGGGDPDEAGEAPPHG